MKQIKYVVEHLDSGKYLGKKYFVGEKVSYFSEAYRFSAFELKLASKVLLIPKNDYRVYAVEVEDENIGGV